MTKPAIDFLREDKKLDDSLEENSKKFFGVVSGIVIDNSLDAVLQGRVRVQLPFVDCLDLQPWARIVRPMAGPGHGSYSVPNVGDQVLLAFENGNLNAPYILGSLFNAVSFPPLPSPVPQIRTERTLVGNQIVFTEAPPTLTIQNGPTAPGVVPSPPSPTGPHQTISLNGAGVQTIASTITLNAGTVVSISGGGAISIIAGAAMTITSTGPLTITAPCLNIGGNVNIVGSCLVNGHPVIVA